MMSRITRGFSSLKRTALYDYHVQTLGGKMVPFAGYEMPVEYKTYSGGVLKEHFICRESAALFDVGHMGQVKIHGKDRIKFLDRLIVGDLNGLKDGSAMLSLITNERGGIIDDTVVTKFPDHISMVVNAGCKDKDLAHLNLHLHNARSDGLDVTLDHLQEQALIAVQGPKAAEVVQKMLPNVNLAGLKFMTATYTVVPELNNAPILITRCGYTGEDGFEISVPDKYAVEFTDVLMKHGEGQLKPVGLGARDSLRLEAGLCLYGHDLNEDISPIEATLAWTISKAKKEKGGFLGDKQILDHIKNGVTKKRVGFVVQEGSSAREGAILLNSQEETIGTVTSGGISPVLKHPIGMAYVQTSYSKLGTELLTKVRGKNLKVKVSKMPFVPQRYYK